MRRVIVPPLAALLLLLAAFSLAPAQVRGPLVVSDRWPETSDAMTWLKDVFRLDGVEQASERDKAISLYNWLRLFNRLCEGVGGMAHAFEGPWGQEQFVIDLNKHLLVYGWGYCSTHSLVAEGLWQEYLQDSLAADRVVYMHENQGYHTVYRLRMDGRFGAFDARYGYYLLESDNPAARILDFGEVGEDRNVWANLKFANRCRPFVEFPQHEFERVLWLKPKPTVESEDAWRAAGAEPEVTFRNRQYRYGAPRHDMNFVLPRGTTIERHWDNRMKKWYIPKKDQDMFLPEGRFYRVGASLPGADGEKNDPNLKYYAPYLTEVPTGLGYPSYLEGDRSLGQAWGVIRYEPDLARGDLEEVKVDGGRIAAFAESPQLRPSGEEPGEWTLEFYSPYILVDGIIMGELVGGPNEQLEIAFRSEAPKPRGPAQPDQWLPWRTITERPGPFRVYLSRADAAEGGSSFHGAYRYQLRIRLDSAGPQGPFGLNDLKIITYFENGIMSLPQLFAGDNTVRFKVEDAARVKGDLLVTYDWQSADGARSHRQRIVPEQFFHGNEALFRVEAPKLIRCNSVTIAYP